MILSAEETPSAPEPISLPTPKRSDRWQPLRSGVLNLYRYDYEEFHYEDGRLLLRGNNGSGKSRVLALQLPFLLDGEVSPARIEPDGDPAKRIEWNLLMGRYPDRTGYTWIEFGRRDADGTLHFLTLGCGMRAVAGHSGLHSHWFFITSQRVGRDLFLQNAQRTPLGRDRLAEAIGSAGRIILKVKDYRSAVDEALFGLGPRFGPLLELLLRLRRPQLSRKLDEEELSNALSDALPTLPSAIIDEVAESFQSLQADRERLREFTSAQAAVVSFLGEYSIYVRMAVRRRARTFRATQSAYESAQRAMRDAQLRLEAAVAQLATLEHLRSELELQLAGAEATERTLRESPEMRTADEVRLAAELATQAEQSSSEAKNDEQNAAKAAMLAQSRQQSAAEQFAKVAHDLTEKHRTADAAAAGADLSAAHRQSLAPLPAQISDFQFDPGGEAVLRRIIVQRERAIALLRAREQALAEAERVFQAAEHEQRRAEEAASAAREEEHNAHAKLDAAAAQLVSSYDAWRGSTVQVSPPSAESVADAFSTWIEQRQGPSPLRLAAESAHASTIATLAGREARFTQVAAELAAQIQDLDTAIDRLEKGDTPPPPPPIARRADRQNRSGAPLWRVCDFRPDVSAEARAGIEAALHASGLLDAWVLPDGQLLGEEEDTFILGTDQTAPLVSPKNHLGEVLIVAIDSDHAGARSLTRETLEGVLARIGYGHDHGAHWIASDGRWQLGPLAGRASKAAADYIGESTRAAARRRQLAELRAQHDAACTARQRVIDNLANVTEARTAAAAELARAPTEDAVLRAGYTLETASRRLSDTLVATERATRAANAHRTERDERAKERERDAADLNLLAWMGRLDGLANATNAYAHALAGLWPTVRHWDTIAAQLAAFQQQRAEAETELDSRRQRREQAAGAAEAARQRFATLQETHGQEVSLILAKLAATTSDVTRLKAGLGRHRDQQVEQSIARTKAESDRTTADHQRSVHEEQRRAAIGSLQRLAEQRLLAEADATLRDIDAEEWSVARVVELVRHRIDAALADTPEDDATWQRRQDAIHGHIQELRDQLITHGHPPETHQSDDIVLVRCVFQGRPHTMTELRDAFAGELQERERLLQAKEREIIENHLLAEAAVELQKLIRAAETWRASANEELSARPTSSGVRFRFQWEPATEIRFHEIRPVLLRKGELWTPAERTLLAEFLQSRIKAEQDADESASWRDQLARALDYRRWHRFVVERQQEGQWRRLNRATYGTGSGGEKALALTLPRFAAAAAHYRSAAKTAPRLVMLDEAFAGIDPTMRAQCMGVLTQFDLDVIMTSEQEWGCYPTVPALAIYHLTTLPGLDAVGTTRWIWNGRQKSQRDAALPPEAAPGSPEDQPRITEDETVR